MVWGVHKDIILWGTHINFVISNIVDLIHIRLSEPLKLLLYNYSTIQSSQFWTHSKSHKDTANLASLGSSKMSNHQIKRFDHEQSYFLTFILDVTIT